jgi:hypothetical protein
LCGWSVCLMAEKQRKNNGRGARGQFVKGNQEGFQKGQSGNPEGRPEGTRNRSTVLKELLSQICDFTNPLTLRKETADLETRLMIALIAKGCRGDVTAIREVQDTVYGKLTEKNELSGALDVNMLTLDEVKKRAAERRKQVEGLDD